MATISVAQMPIGSLPVYHNMLIFRDDNKNPIAEIDGGPVDEHGNIIDFGNSNPVSTFGAFLFGTRPLGVEWFGPDVGKPFHYLQQATQESEIFTGTMLEVARRYGAAIMAARDINNAGFQYSLVPVERQDGQANSNSVASTLIRAMGIDLSKLNLPPGTAPGDNIGLLPPDRIREIAFNIPVTDIPLPRPNPLDAAVPLPRPRPNFAGPDTQSNPRSVTPPQPRPGPPSNILPPPPAGPVLPRTDPAPLGRRFSAPPDQPLRFEPCGGGFGGDMTPGQMPGAAPRQMPDDGFPDDWHVPPSAEGDGFPDDWHVPASAMAPEAARPAPNPQPSVANLASFDRPAAGGPAMGLFGVSRYSLPFGGGPNPPGGPLIPGLFGTVMRRSALAAPAPESEDDDEEE